jgi:hypothetical protein
MGGFLGIGGSSANTDRATQLSAQQGGWNIFSHGLGISDAASSAGTADTAAARTSLGTADQYWKGLLTAGRTETAQNAAPAINAIEAQSDATRSAAGNFGTGRTGGTAAINREAGTTTSSKIDDIINQNLVTGKTAGAQGLTADAGLRAQMGQSEMAQALQAMGLSQEAVASIMKNAADSRATSFDINSATQAQWGELIGGLLAM